MSQVSTDNTNAETAGAGASLVMKEALTQHGISLYELSHQKPVVLVFLRHFG